MADQTIGIEQIGAYEIPLTAGNVTKITIANRYSFVSNRVQISVHDASMPIYARLGNQVSIKDPNAQVIAPGTWLEMQTGYGDSGSSVVSLISAADATVSVARV
ncbi:hypothetical protein [Frigoribacterium sp. RIT-PI-h]|uniref:hypothetical protein n=1 Tax=Frigoribacterium sp. RIT-PI-h TaxID=1690245 RepID=UPI0006B9A668|nr:hypothetical protein [Frigoribacterium sp. RIT-PI-h]KPG86505.1 hypothetical protein AEQ27_04105 [Frigoribacterium sp. RIT-PI-h]